MSDKYTEEEIIALTGQSSAEIDWRFERLQEINALAKTKPWERSTIPSPTCYWAYLFLTPLWLVDFAFIAFAWIAPPSQFMTGVWPPTIFLTMAIAWLTYFLWWAGELMPWR